MFFFKLVILTAFIICGLYIFDFMSNNLFATHAFSSLFNFGRFSLVCSFFFYYYSEYFTLQPLRNNVKDLCVNFVFHSMNGKAT